MIRSFPPNSNNMKWVPPTDENAALSNRSGPTTPHALPRPQPQSVIFPPIPVVHPVYPGRRDPWFMHRGMIAQRMIV